MNNPILVLNVDLHKEEFCISENLLLSLLTLSPKILIYNIDKTIAIAIVFHCCYTFHII